MHGDLRIALIWHVLIPLLWRGARRAGWFCGAVAVKITPPPAGGTPPGRGMGFLTGVSTNKKHQLPKKELVLSKPKN